MSSTPFFSNFDTESMLNDILSGVKAPTTADRVAAACERFNEATKAWQSLDRAIASTVFRLAVQGHLKRRGMGLVKRYLVAGVFCEGANALVHPHDYAEYRSALKVLAHELVIIAKS